MSAFPTPRQPTRAGVERSAPEPDGDAPFSGSVLHVLPTNVRRGAQIYARDLVDALRCEQRVVTIFGVHPALPSTDILGLAENRLRSAGFEPRAALRLRRYLGRHRPSVTIAHGGEALKYLALAGRRRSPIVYLAIGTVPPRFGERKLSRLLYQWAVNRAALVVAVSEDVASETRALFGVRAEAVVVIPNSRDPESFPIADQGHEPSRVLFMGHLTEQKRPDLFLDVVARLRASGSPITAAIAGDGPLRPRLVNRARRLGVDVLGHRDDVAQVLASSSVLVFTSDAQGEGMPGVLIEAGLAGLPVVTFRVPGASSVVLQGETGFIVEHGDVSAMAHAVGRLAEDPALRASMGRAARSHCEQQFSVRSTTAAWEAHLRRVSDTA